ncbi:MAG: flagellar motor switch protein FliN [Deltaproteobacteria bacterium]|nr:flagellar motor switch protein FliN [Deltaproteobacteria bacterium]MBW1736387.1 flagellar motor switch protein FliN [Deltaproteobacteria bacterium]MBW1908126.1 flagellar motor switch protein FliN [Deltaproteobacteria bacterium]MBW2032205.1 flagellar motor switch protein FliN [Deltaproteobacteria bacterium]MBW2113778.1 flagellar motor switch protein FliN [Deltaproteobacteria bacterium]
MAAADENRGKVDSNIADNNMEELKKPSYRNGPSGEAKPDKSQETSEIDRQDTPNKTNDSLTQSNASASQPPADIEFILDIPLEITAELGRTEIRINELLKLGQGSVIEFSKLAGETLDVLANQKLIARGEVVVVNEKYGIRLTEIAPPIERIERLR